MKPALTPPHRAPQNTPAFLLLTAFLLAAPPLAAQLSSLESIWHCDGDLTESRTASPLVANGFTPAYQVETIPGGAATVLDLPALDSGLSQSLALPNPSGPNGSGAPTRTNNWTLVMDIRIGALSNDAALLQTDPANADDAEIRVAGGASAGALVFGADPISDPDTIRPATWYRLALTCDGEGPELQCTAYVNGTQTTLGGSPATLTKTHDGRFALQDTALLCSDDTSETQPVRINCVALWDTALTAAEVAALGGPAAPGLPDLFVSNTANSGPGSLRESIIGLPSGRILSFDLALDAQSIEVDAGGPLAISAKTVTIDALHLSGGLTIDANLNGHRIFEVVSGSELTLRGASLANGIANDLNDDSGGAILNEGTLTVDRCTIEGCHADFSGGAISNNGTLTLCDSTLNSNTAGSGGAVLNSGAAEIKRCTFAGNSGDAAGAIENISSLILTNSTLTGNSATSGGGGAIQTLGSLTVINCTIIGNHSNDPFSGGGGIFRDFFSVTTLENSIVALNTSSVPGEENLGGLFYDQFNETGVNITSGDPLLKSLANYGGPTETMPPDDGSPAKGTGLVIEASTPPTDQRGEPRSQTPGDPIDIGAVEGDSSQPADLPYDVWVSQNLLAGQDTGFSDDSEGDDALNGHEYAFGLDPQNPDPHLLPIASRTFPDGMDHAALGILMPYNPSATDLVYIVEESTDSLVSFHEIYRFTVETETESLSRSGLATFVDPTEETICVTESIPAGPNTFWRVRLDHVPNP